MWTINRNLSKNVLSFYQTLTIDSMEAMNAHLIYTPLVNPQTCSHCFSPTTSPFPSPPNQAHYKREHHMIAKTSYMVWPSPEHTNPQNTCQDLSRLSVDTLPFYVTCNSIWEELSKTPCVLLIPLLVHLAQAGGNRITPLQKHS